jgi:hypothetical protein
MLASGPTQDGGTSYDSLTPHPPIGFASLTIGKHFYLIRGVSLYQPTKNTSP